MVLQPQRNEVSRKPEAERPQPIPTRNAWLPVPARLLPNPRPPRPVDDLDGTPPPPEDPPDWENDMPGNDRFAMNDPFMHEELSAVSDQGSGVSDQRSAVSSQQSVVSNQRPVVIVDHPRRKLSRASGNPQCLPGMPPIHPGLQYRPVTMSQINNQQSKIKNPQ